MSEKITTVEATDQKAVPDQGQGEDFLAILEAKEAEILKVSEERDNYRKGLLKAKGKIPNDGADDVDQIEIMRQVAREEVLKTHEYQLSTEKDTLIKKMARDLSEAKLALKNKAQVSNASQGTSSEETMKVKDNFLSDEQIKYLKAQGKDDKFIERLKDTMRKNKR